MPDALCHGMIRLWLVQVNKRTPPFIALIYKRFKIVHTYPECARITTAVKAGTAGSFLGYLIDLRHMHFFFKLNLSGFSVLPVLNHFEAPGKFIVLYWLPFSSEPAAFVLVS